MSLLDPIAGDPLTPEGAFAQAANRETPFSQYLGQKFVEGLGGNRAVQAGTQALMPAPADYPTDEMRVFGPPGSTLPTTSPRLDKQAYEASPHFREGMPWDEGMTEARASALAAKHDAETYRASVIARYQGGIGSVAGFVAGAAPGLADPTNFVPILGEGAQAAMVARLGTILGHGLTAAGDAAANTAMFEFTNAASARQMGQDFGVRDVATDILGNALAGSLFGLGKGWLHDRAATREALLRTGAKGLPRQADAVNLAGAQLEAGEAVDVAPVLRDAPEMREPVAPPPRDRSIAQEIERQLTAAGATAEDARPQAAVWQSFFDTMGARSGTTPSELFDRYRVGVERGGEAEAGALFQGTPGLDMSHEARMARAAEQGFDTKNVLYHATGRDFAAFDLKRAGTGSNAGNVEKGVFLTDKPEVADTYLAGAYVNAHAPDIVEKLGNLPHEGGVARYYHDGSQVMPTVVRNLDKFEVWDMGGGGYDPDFVKRAIREAKKAKAPGVVFENMRDPGIMSVGRPKASKIVLAFNPGDIRSAHAKFDPREAKGRDLLAQAGGGVTRGSIHFAEDGRTVIRLFQHADASTFLHESGHLFTRVMRDIAGREGAPEGIARDWAALRDWLGVKDGEALSVEHEEKLARGFEAYLRDGEAPTSALRQAFETIKGWLRNVYKSLTELGVEPSPEVRAVFDRMLGGEEKRAAPDFATAKPYEPHPSVAEAADRVGKSTPELETFAGDAGLDGYDKPLPGHEPPEVKAEMKAKAERAAEKAKAAGIEAPAPGPPPGEPDLPPELLDIEALRRAGELPEGADAILADAEREARAAEGWADAYNILASCVLRAAE